MKRLFTALLLPAFSFFIYASEGFHLSVEPIAGIRTGHVGEYVYYKVSSGDYDKISYLQWNIKPEWYGGGSIELSYNRLHISTDITAGLPVKCGEMQDSDWQNLPSNDYTQTNYSVSDNYIKTDIKSGLTVSYDFKPDDVITLSPFAGFDFQYYKFEADNVTLWYGAQNKTTGRYDSYTSGQKIEYITDGSAVMTYKWYSYITWIGLNTDFHVAKRWNLGISGAVAPWVFLSVEDHHILRSIYTSTNASDFFCAFKADLSIRYRISDRLTAGLTGYITMSSEIKGDLEYKASESADYETVENQKYGSDFQFGGCTLYMKYQIF